MGVASGKGPPEPVPVEGVGWGAKRDLAARKRGSASGPARFNESELVSVVVTTLTLVVIARS